MTWTWKRLKLQLDKADECGFSFVNKAGRPINGLYLPNLRNPVELTLFATVRDRTGAAFAVMKQYDVSEMVGASEMAELGDQIEQMAQDREQGQEDGTGVVLRDFRSHRPK